MQLRHLFLSPWKPWLISRGVHVGLLFYKVVQWHICLGIFQFFSISHSANAHIHIFTKLGMCDVPQQLAHCLNFSLAWYP